MLSQRPTHGHDLFALHIADGDIGDYRVSEAGWYAADDSEKVVLGPFETLAECERAIQEKMNSSTSRH